MNTTVKNNYLINYNDSLGLVFGLKQPFKKDPAAKSDLVLAFESSVKTYLKLSQINDNSNPKLNFSLDKLTTEDINNNPEQNNNFGYYSQGSNIQGTNSKYFDTNTTETIIITIINHRNL